MSTQTTSTVNDGLWYISTSFATFGVGVVNGKVDPKQSAPIIQRFAYQPFERLLLWLKTKDRALTVEHLLKPNERVTEKVV